MRVSRQQAQERNRAALLAAAQELIAGHGSRASLDAIAEHAGLTTGAVYSIFGSKRDLVMALGNEIHDQLRTRIRALAETNLTLRDTLGRLVDEWLPGSHRELVTGLRLECQVLLWALDDRKLATALADPARETNTRLAAALTDRVISPEAPDRRTSKAEAEQLVVFFRALVLWYANLQALDGNSGSVAELRATCESLVRLIES